MSEMRPPEGMWVQQGLVPIEYPVIRLRIGGNKRERLGSCGLRIVCGDTDELLGMWAGPSIPIETLEATAASVLAVALERMGLDLKSQDPF